MALLDFGFWLDVLFLVGEGVVGVWRIRADEKWGRKGKKEREIMDYVCMYVPMYCTVYMLK